MNSIRQQLDFRWSIPLNHKYFPRLYLSRHFSPFYKMLVHYRILFIVLSRLKVEARDNTNTRDPVTHLGIHFYENVSIREKTSQSTLTLSCIIRCSKLSSSQNPHSSVFADQFQSVVNFSRNVCIFDLHFATSSAQQVANRPMANASPRDWRDRITEEDEDSWRADDR